MNALNKRATVYFDPDLHRALRMKAMDMHCSISDLVNQMLRNELAEDREDLAAFRNRINEPTMTYEVLLEDLRAHGKI